MTRYERVAQKAIAAVLAGRQDPISLWSLSCTADAATRAVGKKRDLHESLYDYENLLPASWTTRWLTSEGGSGDGMLMAVPRNWQVGSSRSKELILGGGALVAYAGMVD